MRGAENAKRTLAVPRQTQCWSEPTSREKQEHTTHVLEVSLDRMRRDGNAVGKVWLPWGHFLLGVGWKCFSKTL